MVSSDFSLPRIVNSADDAYATALMDVLDRGEICNQASSSSVGSGRESRDILNYSFRIESPRERLVVNAKRRLNLPAAVARFVWMMAASDRLADIAFYEEKARSFSDDDISVPGSNYGQRILSPRPGLNQLKSVIMRLREDAGTRRAAISVYQAEDAVRESKDIPCTFGFVYHLRGGQLISTTIMRSNNAFLLLPYNIFEFSLLAEVVAAELGAPLGPLTHHAVSMHIYKEDYVKAREVATEWLNSSSKSSTGIFPEMPLSPLPLQQIKELIVLEAELRHGSAGLSGSNIENWITKGEGRLHPFWTQMYFLLLLHVAKRNRDQEALLALESVLEEPWHSYLQDTAFKVENPVAEAPKFALRVQGAGASVIPIFSSRAMKSLKKRAAEWEEKREQRLNWEQYARVQEILLETVAARGGSTFEDEIGSEDFEAAMRTVNSIDA